ncbi:MAG: hypothetical protein AMS18_17610 [Gemmatimonas sp. SG8_17]|nr:MAG: hypothetical protein AMS18_17610 [Gemmatimonas sp. SG8_17]
MPPIEPLPFRLRVPGEDVIDFKGIRSVSYRVDGLLHLVDDTLEFEWTATEKTERVSVTGIGTVVDQSPIGRLEVPAGWLAEVELRGWWLPRMRFRARRLDAFQDMPSAKAGVLTLKIRRRFRKQAEALVVAILQARDATPLPVLEPPTELDSDDVPRFSDGGDL